MSPTVLGGLETKISENGHGGSVNAKMDGQEYTKRWNEKWVCL